MDGDEPDEAALDEACAWLDEAHAAMLDARLDDALDLAQRSFAVMDRELGEHPDTANALRTVAQVESARCKYSRALLLAQRATAMMQMFADEDAEAISRISIQVALTLGNIRRELGEYAEAESALIQALNTAASLGLDDLDVAAALNSLGMLHKYQGRFEEAQQRYGEAQAILEQHLGADHPDLASLYHNLGGLAYSRGRYAEGEPIARKAVALRKAALGPDHPTVAADEAALAALLDAQDKLDEADALYQRALATFERVYGVEHFEVAHTCNQLGSVRQRQGRLDDAARLYERALATKQRLFEPEHPELGISLNNLAGLRVEQGAVDEAVRLYERALAIFETTLGADHGYTRGAREDLAALLRDRPDSRLS